MDDGVASSEAQLDSEAVPEADATGEQPMDALGAPAEAGGGEREFAALRPAPPLPLRIDPLGARRLSVVDDGSESVEVDADGLAADELVGDERTADDLSAEMPKVDDTTESAAAAAALEALDEALEDTLDWDAAAVEVDRHLPLADGADELSAGQTVVGESGADALVAALADPAAELADTVPVAGVSAGGIPAVELPDVDDGAEVPELTEPRELSRVLMAVMLSSREPLKPLRLAEICNSTQKAVAAALDCLQADLRQAGMPLEVLRVGETVSLATSPAVFGYLTRMRKVKRAEKLSPAALETLAVVAYRQPVIRAEIEAIRGVKVGPMLKTLLDHKLVTVVGREDVPGRPLQYGTTQLFLDRFGLASIDELPSVQEFRSLG